MASKHCARCNVELINNRGVHMGTPFAKKDAKLVCATCYDYLTVNPDTHIQRTGDEII